MHLLVVGGGSAGHVVPALPVIERFVRDGAQVTFVGTRSGLEERLVAQTGAAFEGISAGKLRRYLSFENVTDVGRIFAGLLQAWRIIGRVRPDVVFSKGGFVAFPVVVAAWLRRVPVVAHESDLTPGLANRLCKPFVATLCSSFAETRFGRFNGKVVHTGSPLRPELANGDAARGRSLLGFATDKPILLVTGGSLGAQTLNEVVREGLDRLAEDFNVVHVSGAGKSSASEIDGYRQFEYVGEGWGDLLAAADVVVSRAGANALFELLSLRKVCLLVPLSARSSRGDQIANAGYVEKRGLAHVLGDDQLTPELLLAALQTLREGRAEIERNLAGFEMPDAVTLICAEIEQLASAD